MSSWSAGQLYSLKNRFVLVHRTVLYVFTHDHIFAENFVYRTHTEVRISENHAFHSRIFQPGMCCFTDGDPELCDQNKQKFAE